MKSAFLASRIAVLVCLGATFSALAWQSSPGGDPLADLDPGWVESWRHEIDRQVDMFASAYNMSEDEAATFRSELEARLLLQKSYDDQMNAELEELQQQIADSGVQVEDENHPLIQKLNQRFAELTKGMPLNDNQTAAWVESRVSPEVAAEGRARFEELVQREKQEQIIGRFDQELAAGKKGTLTREAMDMTAQVDPIYNRPVPTSDLAQRVEAQDRLNRIARNIEPTRGRRDAIPAQPQGDVPQIEPPRVVNQPVAAQPVDIKPATPPASSPPRPVVSDPSRDPMGAGRPPVAKPAAPPEPPPQPAPPLDEWEKYVLATADKYGFDDAQLTNARSILSDLRRRAYQYQTSRAEAFARMELMTDAKAREAEKKALNKPLDALFAELKARLESLPTQSQRQKAGQPAKK